MSNILVVDDEAGIRELLQEILHDEGHQVRLAENAEAARQVRGREQPDLVLLDVGLPKLNGLDVCRALKTNPVAPRVLLITGNADLPGLDDCGADGVVTKPFRPLELLDVVQRQLDGAGVHAA